MHVLSKKPFMDAAKRYPKDASALDSIYKALEKGNFQSPEQMRHVFATLDNFRYEDKWWILDIAGNNLRLLAYIDFQRQKVYIKHILNHPDYDKFCKKYASR